MSAFETSVVDRSDYPASTYPNRIRVEWSSTQNVSSNSSTIYWNVYPVGGTGRRFGAFHNITVVLGGNTIVNNISQLWGRADGSWSYSSFNSDGSGGDGTTLSGSFTIMHNSDGTKTLTGSAQCAIYVYTINSTRTGYSADLPTIARASTVSCGSGTIGSPMTITINKTSSSYTHTLRYAFGSASGTIVSNTSASSYSWTPPSSLASQIPTSSSGTGTIYCDTYSGSTKLGTNSCTLTLNIAGSSGGTTINSFIPTPVNTSLSGCTSYIKDESCVKWTVSATPASGAYITKYSITGPSLSASESTSATTYSATSGTLVSTGTKVYTVTVTDSRNNTVSTTGTITVTDDGGLSISASVNRSGTSATHTVSASFQTYGNTNTVKIVGYYKAATSSSYTAFNTFKNDAKDSPMSFTYTQRNLDKDTAYDFKYVISDSMGNSATTYSNVGGKRVAINIASGDNGVGIGKMSSGNGEFECAFPARFDSDIYVGANIKVRNKDGEYVDLSAATEDDKKGDGGIAESGSWGIWDYIKYSDGQCDLWGRVSVSTNITQSICGGKFFGSPELGPYELPFPVYNQVPVANYVSNNWVGGIAWPLEDIEYGQEDRLELSPMYRIVRPDSASGSTGVFAIHIHGWY